MRRRIQLPVRMGFRKKPLRVMGNVKPQAQTAAATEEAAATTVESEVEEEDSDSSTDDSKEDEPSPVVSETQRMA
ncbi:unnamed protein product [Aphanomyces euteiches]